MLVVLIHTWYYHGTVLSYFFFTIFEFFPYDMNTNDTRSPEMPFFDRKSHVVRKLSVRDDINKLIDCYVLYFFRSNACARFNFATRLMRSLGTITRRRTPMSSWYAIVTGVITLSMNMYTYPRGDRRISFDVQSAALWTRTGGGVHLPI